MNRINSLKLTAIAFILLTQIGFSQTEEEEIENVKQPIKIGVKGGYSLGKLSNADDNIYTQNYESTSGFDFGLTFEFPMSELFSFQTEINFTNRGGVRTGLQPVTGNELSEQLNMFLPFINMPLITDENPLYASFESESELKYLEIPALAKFGWGDDFRFFAEIGPYVGILLNAEQVTSGSSQFFFDSQGTSAIFVPNPTGGQPSFIELPAQSLDATTDVKDDLKTVNFGGIIGIGASKKMGDKGELFADARASYSFNTIQIKDTYGESRVGGVIFSLGYAYSL
ncbi:MAG: PorT family protein [Urechidicola sp.]|nr:PorT family protein [Urechidicola sp.]